MNELQNFIEQRHPELWFIIEEFRQFLWDAEAEKFLKEQLALVEAKKI